MRLRASGIVYQNSRPELRAVHAWHPSLVRLANGSLMCSFDLGQGPESLDYTTYLSSSDDEGATWTQPRGITAPVPSTLTVRLGIARDGSLTAAGARLFRNDPDAGIINHPGLGYTPMELVVLRSSDDGRSWTQPEAIAAPITGPAFETCHRLVELADGRWLWPTSTWPDWDGNAPEGMKAVVLVSDDRGASWPRYLTVLDRWDDGIAHWEQSVVELSDGRVVVVAWALNTTTGETLPTPFAVAPPGGEFGPAHLTGLAGQTTKIAALPDDRLLVVYRRHDVPGLWGALATVAEDSWDIEDNVCLWDGASSGMAMQASVGEELSALAFGYPSILVEPGKSPMVAFWCRENCLYTIRWISLDI